ncbi:rCG29640 [Rattus norvegicus]|uniref:RCG29640 n=1 Tax=Rattus norvegicus TaxID=10116 RepID=A6IMX7_RAT|nr:rCG29640 [Rattus norvegicus]
MAREPRLSCKSHGSTCARLMRSNDHAQHCSMWFSPHLAQQLT